MRRLSLLMGLLSLGLLLCRGASPAAAEGHPSDRRAQWVARYGGPFGNPDYAADIVAAPDGSAVYVTGAGATGNNSWSDYATLAYDAHTGEREWLARYDGPIAEDDSALAMAVSPDGSRVFVTGHSAFAGAEAGWATLAYDAHTGAELWLTRLDNPNDFVLRGPSSIQVSPDGSTVYLTGADSDPSGNAAWTTAAYDAATGGQRWIHYLGFGNGSSSDLAISPDGKTVYVTSESFANYSDIITIAYDATTGHRESFARYSSPGRNQDVAYAIGVSPDGARVFVTGEGAAHYVTVAYDSTSLSQLWVSTYHGPGDTTDAGYALAVSPDGTQVSVTGYSAGISGNSDYGTVTYDASSGAEMWVARYVGDMGSVAWDLAYSPDDRSVFVTGGSWNDGTESDYVTVKYAATDGEQVSVARLDGPMHANDTGVALAVSPLGTEVFVTGLIDDTGVDYPPIDYGTVAYGTG